MDLDLLRLSQGLLEVPGVRGFCWLVRQPWAGLLLAVLVIADAVRRRQWWQVPTALAAVIAADTLCARVLKPLFARPRPCLRSVEVLAPLGCGGGWSMPSCHAANAFAIALVLGQPWALGLAFLVALARVVAGQHYPSDAVVGALVGAAVGGAARTAAEALLRRFRRARTPRRPRAGPAAAVRSE